MAVLKYTISFRLNRGLKIDDKKQHQFIYFRYRQGREVDFSASIGFSIPLEDWNTEKQTLRNKAHIQNRNEIDSFITGVSQHFKDEIIKLAGKRIHPNRYEVKQIFNEYVNPKPKAKSQTLFSFIDNYIKDAETEINVHTKDKRPVKDGTLRGYGLTKNILLRFHKERYHLNLNNLDLVFYKEFLKFCYKNDLSTNYIGKHIKTIKIFLSNALDKGLTTNLDFKKKQFATISEKTDAIYLNEDELFEMYKLNLSSNKTLDIARDLFLIGSYTGLRISDYHKLNINNIEVMESIEFCTLETQKTEKTVSIPLHFVVKRILKKYDGMPPVMQPQKLNNAIKEVGKLAEIDKTTTDAITKGGQKRQVNKPKYLLIKSHTARRSFCTNAYLSGIEVIDIMKISGHTTQKNFLKYIKVKTKKTAVRIGKSQFFIDNSKYLKIVS